MRFLLDVVFVGCNFILFMLLPFLSSAQYLIVVLIAYSFMLGLEPSYLEKMEVLGILIYLANGFWRL